MINVKGMGKVELVTLVDKQSVNIALNDVLLVQELCIFIIQYVPNFENLTIPEEGIRMLNFKQIMKIESHLRNIEDLPQL